MKTKKVLSTAVASALVAAQMVMPVMAADGGELGVDVTTKTAVIRVDVPTTMAIAVDQFMMTDSGTQISSSAFTMANKSAVDVKVEVTSTALLGTATKLVASKDGAASSTEVGEAWLGVAAQSAQNAYDDPSTDTSDATAQPPVNDTPETIATLTDANANVATFVQGTGADAAKGKATQTFYLQKGAGQVDYKLLDTTEDVGPIEYAQFYKLTAQTVGDQNALNTLLANGPVYVATAVPAAGQALELVEKGGSHTYAGTEKYYTAADVATAKTGIGDPGRADLYVYGGTANADTDGNAAFRYIGILSGGQESWSNTDISKITIKYDIVGVTADKYADVSGDCTYGLYYGSSASASRISVDATGLMTMAGVNSTNWKGGVVVLNGTEYAIGGASGTWVDATSDPAKFQFADAWVNNIKGKEITVKVTLKDDTVIEETLTVPES